MGRSLTFAKSLAAVVFALSLAPYVLAAPSPERAAAAAGSSPARGATSDNTSAAEIDALIAQLGDLQFATREQAQRKLAKLESRAFDALLAARLSDDVEVASRADYLIRQVKIQWTQKSDTVVVRQLLESYPREPEVMRLLRMRRLAQQTPEVGLEPLTRIVRFELSDDLSQQGALLILRRLVTFDQISPEVMKKILATAGTSTRPSVTWIRLEADFAQDPGGAIARWGKMVAAERRRLRTGDGAKRQILIGLMQHHVSMLTRANRADEAEPIFNEILAIESGQRDTLADLLAWLSTQKAVSHTQKLASKFAMQFNNNPLLRYQLAECYLKQQAGDLAQAEAEAAYRAVPPDPQQRYELAKALMKRGVYDWSEREFRRLQQGGPGDEAPVLDSYYRFSLLLHDQQRYQEAAASIRALIELAQKQPSVMRKIMEGAVTLESLQARMNFYSAMAAAQAGNFSGHRELLEKAASTDNPDTDVLIALYRAPGKTPERQEEVRKMIREAVDKLKVDIADAPQEHGIYNELAWLISNTEGDFDQALRYSQTSLELNADPDNITADTDHDGGYLDTLAHCYAAKKDFKTAFEVQRHAVAADPGCLQIQRALDEFRGAMEMQQANKPAADPPGK